jgi:hypothetical protein
MDNQRVVPVDAFVRRWIAAEYRQSQHNNDEHDEHGGGTWPYAPAAAS